MICFALELRDLFFSVSTVGCMSTTVDITKMQVWHVSDMYYNYTSEGGYCKWIIYNFIFSGYTHHPTYVVCYLITTVCWVGCYALLCIYSCSSSQPTTSANKMVAERMVWYLWANSLVLAIPKNSGQSDQCMVTCLPKSHVKLGGNESWAPFSSICHQ